MFIASINIKLLKVYILIKIVNFCIKIINNSVLHLFNFLNYKKKLTKISENSILKNTSIHSIMCVHKLDSFFVFLYISFH